MLYKPIPLYTFDQINFTTHGKIGRFGPKLSDCDDFIAENGWAADKLNFSIEVDGIQRWRIPETSLYRIKISGAGGLEEGKTKPSGGKGFYIQGDVQLQAGNTLSIVVGQTGIQVA